MSAARERRRQLLTALRQEIGPIRTGDVMRLYRENGWGPNRSTARNDLQYLARQGVLIEHGPECDRWYTLNSRPEADRA